MKQANLSKHEQLVEVVAHKHLCRQASYKAWRSFPKVASTSDFNPIIVGDFLSSFSTRVALKGLVSQAKKIISLFSKSPKLWDSFKKLLGIESVREIPAALKKLGDLAVSALKKALHTLFVSWPLKLFTLPHQKIFSFNAWLDKIVKSYPKLKQWVDRVSHTIGDWGEWVRKKAPHITGLVMAAIYIWVWVNVVEFEWDAHSFLRALTGQMDFHDFLTTIPGSAFGFLLNVFDIGTFTLLPYVISARILVLIYYKFVVWDGDSFIVTPQMSKEFGVEAGAF